MTKWEYMIVNVVAITPIDQLSNELNVLGSEGWETYWAHHLGGEKFRDLRFYLKRPVRDPE